MLKDYGYGGTYHDKYISVGILLENPSDYGMTADTLVFNISIAPKNSADKPSLNGFDFYLMDENGHIYNTRLTSDIRVEVVDDNDDESAYYRDGFICTEFRLEFLFQDLRVVLFDKTHNSMKIINLEH